MLLAGIIAALAFAGIAAADAYNLTLTLDPASPITYGQTSDVSGSLLHQGTNDPASGASISAGYAADCSSAFTGLTGSPAVTDGNGSWDAGDLPYLNAGSYGVAAWLTSSSEIVGGQSVGTTCHTLTVNKADTTTSITSHPATLAAGSSLGVGYEVSSANGVSGNYTQGSASLSGTAPCAASHTFGATEVSQTTGSGFDTTGTLTCTANTPGFYTYNVGFSDSDGNYNDSHSDDVSTDVTPVTTQVCMAAPAIVANAMTAAGIKQGSKIWQTVITWVAGNTGSNGLFFAKGVCDPDYRSTVIIDTNANFASTQGYKPIS